MNRTCMGLLLVTLLGLGISGCSFAPEYQRPVMDIPEAWVTPARDSLEVQWWKRFQDDKLNALVEEALQNNRDIEQALARVDFAAAQLGIARSELFPTPGLSGSSARSRSSRNMPGTVRGYETRSVHSVDLGATRWELDIWGKYRNLSDAALAHMLASQASHDAVWLSVAGQTTRGYFLLRTHDLQEETAANTLKTREEAFRIYSARYDQGLIDELDLLRVKAEVETARSSLYKTRVGRDATESALAALLGRSPREILREGTVERGRAMDDMPTAPVFPAGLPSELLERRPDLRAAEENLRAMNFNIGAAKAAFFPNISLTGALGFASTELDSLLTGNARTWQFGGGLYLPLDFWRLQSNLHGAEAKQREAIAAYQQAVQNAFREMRDALSQEEQYANVVRSLESQVGDLRRAVELAKTRYDNGYSAYLEVLDAERSLFTAELELAVARNNHLSGIVNVCLAMGGGWE